MGRITRSLMVAIAENNVIGKDGKLPWKIPEEMKYFKEVTMGKAVIMGRKTFESIGCKPLPGRINIVLSKEPPVADVLWFQTLPYALSYCERHHGTDYIDHPVYGHLFKKLDEVIVIGGSGVYKEALPLMDKLYLTRVHAEFEGDTFFPQMDFRQWVTRASSAHDSKSGIGYSTQVFVRDSNYVPPMLI